jgi:hypothetical protein
MVWIGFPGKGLKKTARRLGAAYLLMLLLGGGLGALWNLTGGAHFWVLAAAGVFVCLLAIAKIRTTRQRQGVYEVLLVSQNRKIPVQGFYDSGNLLWDPLLQQPVHLIQRQVVAQELAQEKQLRTIPYHSLGTPQGILPVLVLDGMYISMDTGKKKRAAYISKPVLGIAEEALFTGRSYQMILHTTTME